MKITQINDSHVGKLVRFKRGDIYCESARVFKEDNTFFLLQNYLDGGIPYSWPKHSFGYKYSYNLGNGNVKAYSIKDLELISNSYIPFL